MKAVAPVTDVLLVVGSKNSSNSMRLVEVCRQAGVPAYLIDDHSQIDRELAAGAMIGRRHGRRSAPENLVQEVVVSLR